MRMVLQTKICGRNAYSWWLLVCIASQLLLSCYRSPDSREVEVDLLQMKIHNMLHQSFIRCALAGVCFQELENLGREYVMEIDSLKHRGDGENRVTLGESEKRYTKAVIYTFLMSSAVESGEFEIGNKYEALAVQTLEEDAGRKLHENSILFRMEINELFKFTKDHACNDCGANRKCELIVQLVECDRMLGDGTPYDRVVVAGRNLLEALEVGASNHKRFNNVMKERVWRILEESAEKNGMLEDAVGYRREIRQIWE